MLGTIDIFRTLNLDQNAPGYRFLLGQNAPGYRFLLGRARPQRAKNLDKHAPGGAFLIGPDRLCLIKNAPGGGFSSVRGAGGPQDTSRRAFSATFQRETGAQNARSVCPPFLPTACEAVQLRCRAFRALNPHFSAGRPFGWKGNACGGLLWPRAAQNPLGPG